MINSLKEVSKILCTDCGVVLRERFFRNCDNDPICQACHEYSPTYLFVSEGFNRGAYREVSDVDILKVIRKCTG
ncbi:MAG: hypothetical protein ACYSTS_19415 [Planctomycetota bacterium]|jgi:hypothetical protein